MFVVDVCCHCFYVLLKGVHFSIPEPYNDFIETGHYAVVQSIPSFLRNNVGKILVN